MKLSIQRAAVGLLLGMVTFWLAGCGGGGQAASPQAGGAMVTVQWPDTSRLIPSASQSVLVAVLQGTTVLQQQLAVRPPLGGDQTLTFPNLPPVALVLQAQAFPRKDGTGVAQAGAQVAFTVQPGQNQPVTITMSTTIASLFITPLPISASPVVNVGKTLQLQASGLDSATPPNTVLTSPVRIHWTSSDPTVASIDASGLLTGIKAGTTVITAVDTESGKSTQITITVS